MKIWLWLNLSVCTLQSNGQTPLSPIILFGQRVPNLWSKDIAQINVDLVSTTLYTPIDVSCQYTILMYLSVVYMYLYLFRLHMYTSTDVHK